MEKGKTVHKICRTVHICHEGIVVVNGNGDDDDTVIYLVALHRAAVAVIVQAIPHRCSHKKLIFSKQTIERAITSTHPNTARVS